MTMRWVVAKSCTARRRSMRPSVIRIGETVGYCGAREALALADAVRRRWPADTGAQFVRWATDAIQTHGE